MSVIKSSTVQRTSNRDNSQGYYQARVNQEKLGAFMTNLVKNYNNPALATLREWVSNASDSHTRSGQTRPVEVTLPTELEPVLTVQDWGLGMSAQEVRDNYSVFLTSTKDQDNVEIGAFGIGGKSALALADQYTMVTVKDGLKNVFLFERSYDTAMLVNPLISDAPTDEPNGVKLSVAVQDVRAFREEQVKNVLHGWKPEQLKILGNQKIVSLWSTSIELKSGLIEQSLFNGNDESQFSYHNSMRLLVGPVAYPAPHYFVDQLRRGSTCLRTITRLALALAW